MVQGTRLVTDVLRIVRLALGRRNSSDPDSTDEVFLRYINDFISLEMSDDVKLFENFSTLSFVISEDTTVLRPFNNGVYTFNELLNEDGVSPPDFVNISSEAFISLLDPIDESISWNRLLIYQNPGEFFSIWGINNDEILIPGYPTSMLYYGNEFTFRTIPDTSYMVKIYGYKKINNYPSVIDDDFNGLIQFDYWLRYLAYGAAITYARDYRYASDVKAELERDFRHFRKLMLTHTHNQIKLQRSLPRF